MVKVSIISLAYNQEKFIKQALDSFAMQKTDFPFEVIIHDDASTDKTADIIREYEKKYPKIIKPIYETENQYSKGPYDFINDMFRSAKGEYIAICEGDDYWTDPEKLQKQVDYLEKNPKFALCFHPVKVFFENKEHSDYIYPGANDGSKFTVAELLKTNFIQSNSVMYRRQDYRKLPNDIMPQDWYLHLYHAQFGKIGFINEVMSAYRRHAGGVWWESDKNVDVIWEKYGLSHLKLFTELRKMYKDKEEYVSLIDQHTYRIMRMLVAVDQKHGTKLIKSVIAQIPETIKTFILYADQQTEKLESSEAELLDLKQLLAMRDEQIGQKIHELKLIKSSRIWKLRNRLVKLIGKK